jgi:phage shock protein A
MEERANIFEGGIDRVQSAWTSVEDEFEKLQKRVEKRRKRFEKETEKQVKWLRKTPLAKRVESFRDDATRQLEANFENFLGLLPVASQASVKRLERKVSQLTRKLNALEKAQTSGPRAKSPARGARGNGAADAGQAVG